ncbi:hypothetical protein BABINDRAFT_25115, partial [Babjeviella inositovora NRRL Y-12698]
MSDLKTSEAPVKPVETAEPAVAAVATTEDDDFDDLLDEFQDEILSKPPGSAAVDENATPTADDLSQINDVLKEMGLEDPESKAQLESLLSQFGGEAGAGPQDFKSIMAETLLRVKTSGVNIDEQLKSEQAQKKGSEEEMLMSLLSGLGGAGGDEEGLAALLSEMMEQLSSKAVLYEPMKDLNDKYPAWLAENKASLKADEYTKYDDQFLIVKIIVLKFESPEYDDSNTFMRNEISEQLELLQKSGDPPAELVGDMDQLGGLFGGGAEGAPGLGEDDDFNMDDLPEDLKKSLQE